MSSTQYSIEDRGIFRALPTISPEFKGLTAIITGANGISGFHTLRALVQTPGRWKKIWTMSRRPPSSKMMDLLTIEQRSIVEHISIDFLSEPQAIAKSLAEKQVVADAIFFYSYAQPPPEEGERAWSNAETLVKINGALLANFLSALKIASITPKRILLQTGGKYYGAHLGTHLSPCIESAPRVTIEPNFYYGQEDKLMTYCRENNIGWNVIRPAWIIGATENAQMNPFYTLAVYAAVQARLGRPLSFPSDLTKWLDNSTHGSAMLTGYLSEWAVLEEKCRDQAFNAGDSGPLSWAVFWPDLARWFGIKDVQHPELDQTKLQTLQMPYQPPPLGYGPAGSRQFSWTFSTWAGQSENHQAWKEIMAEHGLIHDPFEDIGGNFGIADAATWMIGNGGLSMNKARSFGWNGFVDTTEAAFMSFQELAQLGLLPPMVVDGPKQNV